jgi:hypothetical protein
VAHAVVVTVAVGVRTVPVGVTVGESTRVGVGVGEAGPTVALGESVGVGVPGSGDPLRVGVITAVSVDVGEGTTSLGVEVGDGGTLAVGVGSASRRMPLTTSATFTVRSPLKSRSGHSDTPPNIVRTTSRTRASRET